MQRTQQTIPDSPIVFYDGNCALCSRVVQWFLKHDQQQVLFFAPLQGETASAVLPPLDDDPATWSIVLHDASGLYDNSEGAIRAAAHLGGMWSAAKWLLILPQGVRDAAYRFIAKHRYQWFGRHDACWVGSGASQERFLP